MRIAVRALILKDDRLLLVNAYNDHRHELWCAPGGGVDAHSSLHENLAREIYEETGLTVQVGDPVMVNEFHKPEASFHQVEVFFRCTIIAGTLDDNWRDPEAVVSKRQFFSRDEMANIATKPNSLAKAAWGSTMIYDPLELLFP